MNFKAQKQIEGKPFDTEEDYVAAFTNAMKLLWSRDEAEHFLRFGPSFFKGKAFEDRFNQIPVHVLDTWGECKQVPVSEFPGH